MELHIFSVPKKVCYTMLQSTCPALKSRQCLIKILKTINVNFAAKLIRINCHHAACGKHETTPQGQLHSRQNERQKTRQTSGWRRRRRRRECQKQRQFLPCTLTNARSLLMSICCRAYLIYSPKLVYKICILMHKLLSFRPGELQTLSICIEQVQMERERERDR